MVYRIARSESKIYEAIDSQNNALMERIFRLESRFDVYLTSFQEKKEMIDYLIHALDEKINHKFSRLHGDLQQLQTDVKALSGKG
ncbi:MAG: hypothetical protein HEQ35_26805 [Gloeotrichia echinulata IR180]|jgi:hypothetical protein|nr:hypothetical protein [Gloeotrichia echinulata DEX184]